jgi:hypothetical protein
VWFFQNKVKIYQYEVIFLGDSKKGEDTDYNNVSRIEIHKAKPFQKPYNLEFNKETSAIFKDLLVIQKLMKPNYYYFIILR